MSSRIHPQARTTPKIRQEIKDSSLSDRQAAEVFNITRATAKKWLTRDDVQDRSHRAHTLHTTLSAAQETIVLALRQSLYCRSTICSSSLGNTLIPRCLGLAWLGF
jgi:predicted XRE-type DNA-binding protein